MARNTRNYYDEAKRNLLKQDLSNIIFEENNYKDITVANALIYCDPPYKDTKQYSVSKNFNHDEFWQWVREMSKNNIVVVSEEQAPDDFRAIWEQPTKRTIDNKSTINGVEKLWEINK